MHAHIYVCVYYKYLSLISKWYQSDIYILIKLIKVILYVNFK